MSEQTITKKYENPAFLPEGQSLHDITLEKICKTYRQIKIPYKYDDPNGIDYPVFDKHHVYLKKNNQREIKDSVNQQADIIRAYFQNPLSDFSMEFDTDNAHNAYKLAMSLNYLKIPYKVQPEANYFYFFAESLLNITPVSQEEHYFNLAKSILEDYA